MPRPDRFVLYTACAATLVPLAWVGMTRATGPTDGAPTARAGVLGAAAPVLGMAGPPAQSVPEPVRLATCDVYSLVERLIGSSDFYVPRKQEEERLKSELGPLEARLSVINTSLQGADPSKPENQAIKRDYQLKSDEYFKIRKDAQAAFGKMVAAQYADAYARVQELAIKFAREQGYTHVANQRSGKMKPTADAQKIAEEFLSRPYLVTPAGSDITEQVRQLLKLPEQAELDPSSLSTPDDPKKDDGK